MIAQSFYAMEDETHALQNIKTLTSTKPAYVQYLTRDTMVVRERGLPAQCSIVDIEKDEVITSFPYTTFAANPKNKKIAFSFDNYITIYNPQTKIYEWLKEETYHIDDFDFRCDDILVLSLYNRDFGCDMIVQHDYVKNVRFDGCNKLRANYVRVIALHPKKPMMCMTDDTIIRIYNLMDVTTKPREINLLNSVYGCCMGSNDFIAVKTTSGDKIFIIDTKRDDYVWPSIQAEKDEYFMDMLFYPKGSVLVTRSLNQQKNLDIIRYWNIITKRIICTVPFVSHTKVIWNFSFSFDAKKIALACDNKCLSGTVPLQLLYEVGIQEEVPYVLFLLRNYNTQQLLNQDLPKDIIELLVHIYSTL